MTKREKEKLEFDVLWVACKGCPEVQFEGKPIPPHVKRTFKDYLGRRHSFGPRGGFNMDSYEEAAELAGLLNVLEQEKGTLADTVDVLKRILLHRQKVGEVDVFPTKASRALYEKLMEK